MAAIRLARRLDAEQRPATANEQAVLARWGSWGAVPDVFDESKDAWSSERAELRELLDEDAYAAARRTTINAHYTDPAIAREMWRTLERLGFDGGTVLEPGAGAGTFIGLAPEDAQMLGIELDPTTAAIARGIYPDADIRTESFADTSLPDGFVDAAIGNVPFGNVQLHDPVHNPGRRYALHNHFILKSLAATRPGGLVAVLTSHFTMDAGNPAARRAMNQLGDLVGAVRLPSGAHRRSAGTEAVTDLLVFRRREPGEPVRSQLWETVTARSVDGETVAINSYFDTRPENILGELHVAQGMHGATTLHVTTDLQTVPARLRTALDSVVADAREQELTMTARSAAVDAARAAFVPTDATAWDGTIVRVDDTSFARVVSGRREPMKVSKKNTAELGRLLDLREGVTRLLDLEAHSTVDTAEISNARAEVRTAYESYVARYGPINRFTITKAGARLTPEAPRLMKGDPFGPAVLALELFDDESQTATAAAVLDRRVVAPRPQLDGAETPEEALALSMDRHGAPDLATIAHLLGVDESTARAQLGTHVFDDPAQDGQIVAAAEYLSGNVRAALDVARAAAAEDPDRYSANVEALEAVVPETIGSEQIEARIGAVWISAEIHQQFFRETLRDRSFRVENPLPGEWVVRGNRHTLQATEEFGTNARPAPDIAAALLEQRPVEVRVEIEVGDSKRRVIDAQETTAAQEKADLLQERFSEWVWEDAERANALVTEYNRRFNAIRLRSYDNDGAYLTLPGVAESFTPRPHQRAAVARMVAEPAVGLFHQVGAGKTAEMVMGAMELGRMGLISKPAVVVPNHMLEQFSREWLQVYPQARLLAATSDDLSRDRRRMFVAKVAANDWDAVVMTREAFKKLPLSPDVEHAYIAREVAAMREALEAAQESDSDRMSIKRIEKAVTRMEERQKELTELPRDPGLTFEATGIDYLIVDEAHDYKNLTTTSKIPGAGIDGSQAATDLHMKLEYLRSRHGKRVATLATATPIANSVTEAFVLQRYLRPDLLEDAGIRVFDQWAATFGQTVTEMEMAPTGGANFRMKTRFARFQNVPEMLRLWHVFSDVKTAEDLNLPTPALRERPDGKRLPETHVIAPGPQMEQYLQVIAERAEAVADKRVTPDQDNMLWISNDGRKAALDVRMVGLDPEPVDSKLDVAAAEILSIWRDTKDLEYVDPLSGDPSPVRGGLQLVFSDLGTPNADGRWSAYEDLKRRLVDGGMEPDSVRFMHEARNDAEKARMFAAARAGRISVLMGSTQKMGVGTNVQARAIALHHLDCPWRPADVEQRDGRIVRQGNQNAEIGLHRYVVERSFDSYMWQTVERKSRFIAQIMRGTLDVREIEDIGEQALSAAETKAIASGNPLLLEQAQTNDELQKLERLERAHRRSQSNLVQTRTIARGRVDALTEHIETLTAAAPRVIDTSGEGFQMRIGGDVVTKRADAGHLLERWVQRSNAVYLQRSMPLGEVATIGDFTIDARMLTGLGQADVEFAVRDLPDVAVRVPRGRVIEGGIGLVQRLENLQASIPRVLTEKQRHLEETRVTLGDAEGRIGLGFTQADRLAEVRARAEEIRAQMEAQMDPVSPDVSAPVDVNELRQAVMTDAWWDGRAPREIKELLDTSKAAAADSEEHADLYRTLADELRRRHGGTQRQPAAAPPDPSATGPVVGGTTGPGPSLSR